MLAQCSNCAEARPADLAMIDRVPWLLTTSICATVVDVVVKRACNPMAHHPVMGINRRLGVAESQHFKPVVSLQAGAPTPNPFIDDWKITGVYVAEAIDWLAVRVNRA